MSKDEYSPYKIVHHPKFLEDLKEGVNPAPLQVHLVVTNVCNQNCSFCAYRSKGYSSSETFNAYDVIPTGKALEIIRSLASMGTKAIQFTGGGEPLAHPDIDSLLEETSFQGMDIALVTNGTLLNQRRSMLLKDAAWVRVSLDAGTAKTYSSIRCVAESKFDKALKNIENFTITKSKDCVLGIGFVVTKENHHEIYEACSIAKNIGANNFRISASMTSDGIKYFDGFKEVAKEMAANTKLELEDGNFTVFNLFDDRIHNLFDGVQDYDYCPMKDTVVFIGADLRVYTCCVRSYNPYGFIDTLRGQTFEKLWDGEKKREFYKIHNPRVHCKLPCMFEEKNKFMNYCIKKDAKHINFI